MIADLIIGLFFIGIGFLVKKYPMLIAGYNTMSKEKKANVDAAGMGRFLCRWFVWGGIGILAAAGVLYLLKLNQYLDYVSLVAMMVILSAALIGVQKFDHNPKKHGLWSSIIIVAVLVAVFGYIIFFISSSSKDTKVEVSEQNISIKGLYKMELPVDQIKEVSIVSVIPRIKMRTNGFASGNVRKGVFDLDSVGKCRLYLHSLSGPFLHLVDGNGMSIYFSYRDSAKIQALYDEINAAKMRGYIVKVGDMVPSLTLTLLDGSTVTIEDLRGKVVMLQFTASWCSVCRREMPHIESEIWEKLKDNQDFALYGIDLKETPEIIKEFAASVPVTYPITLDPEGELFSLFCTKNAGVTRNIIIDRSGKIIFLTRLYREEEFGQMVSLINSELEK